MLLEHFATWCAAESLRDLTPTVRHHARRALIDWTSALYPGTIVAPATALVAAHRAELATGRSSLPGQGTTAFPALAAWINGSASHAVEMDDIFRDAIYHPGCPTIAAALAIAEDLEATVDELLRAIVIGYEVSTRIGAAIQPAHYRFFHTTGTVGVFGAAAAAAALLAPGKAAVAMHAMATAATFASGLQQAFRSDAMTKALHAGHAAQVGATFPDGLKRHTRLNYGLVDSAHSTAGAQYYDGIGILWLGSPAMLDRVNDDPLCTPTMRRDELFVFQQPVYNSAMVVEERVCKEGPLTKVALLRFIRRAPGTTDAAFGEVCESVGRALSNPSGPGAGISRCSWGTVVRKPTIGFDSYMEFWFNTLADATAALLIRKYLT